MLGDRPSAPPPGSSQQPGGELAPPFPPPLEPRLSLPPGLFREGSLAAGLAGGLGGLGGLGSMVLGSQDLSLDPGLDCALQHMLSLPRLDFDLLTSPKWKPMLGWEDEVGSSGDGIGGGSSSPLHLDTAGSSATATTALPGHFLFEGCGEMVPVSPGISQGMNLGGGRLAAGWCSAAPMHATFSSHHQHQFQQQEQQQQEQRHQGQRGGKKRPGGAPQPEDPQQRTKQARWNEQQQFGRLGLGLGPGLGVSQTGLALGLDSGMVRAGDTLMLDSEGLPAECFPQGPEASDGLGLKAEGGAATDTDAVLQGLGRVRLDSLSSPRQHRRLAAAAAAAAAATAGVAAPQAASAAVKGRKGGVARGDSGVPMLLLSDLPGSPTGGALLPMERDGFEQGLAGAGAGGSGISVEAAAVQGAAASPSKKRGRKGGIEATASPPRPTVSAGASGLGEGGSGGPQHQHSKSVSRQQLPSKSHKAVATSETGVFTSAYRGVTKHRLTGRFEAHFWDASHVRPNVKKGGRSRGRQVYLGGYETELEAARAYDRAVIAHCGTEAPLNFPVEDYAEDLQWMAGRSPEEIVGILRRGSVGFARGQSQYRGVTRHHQAGKWEARIGRVHGNKYLYLGTFDSAEEAARAYDRACVKFRGSKAILNFDLSNYQHILEDPDSYDPVSPAGGGSSGGGGATSATTGGGATSAADAAAAATAAAAGAGFEVAGFPAGLGLAGVVGMEGYGQLVSPRTAAAMEGMAAAGAGGMGGMGGMLWQLAPASHLGLPLMQFPQQQQYQQQYPSLLHQLPPQLLSDVSAATAAAAAPSPSQTQQTALTACPPQLPAIRTRAGKKAAAGNLLTSTAHGSGGSGSTPGSAGTAAADLADFLLSPLAASLLSPLGLAGTPTGWRDSPLGKFSAGDLARLLSGSISSPSGSSPSSSMFSPRPASKGQAQHRLQNVSTAGLTPGAGSGGGTSGGSSGVVHRLASTPTSEADMWAALQWLDSLDPKQLAALAASETPTAAEAAGRTGATAPATAAALPPSNGGPLAN